MRSPRRGARAGSVIVSLPCSSPAKAYAIPARSTGSGGNGLSVENALRPASTIARSRVGTLTTVATTVSAISKSRSEEHTSELQSRSDLVCRLLLEKKKKLKHGYWYTSSSSATTH